MTESFLHGVEVVEIDTGYRPISTVASAIIGIVGTAPLADPAVYPLNTPVLVANSRSKAAKLIASAGADKGTLPEAMDSIFDQAGAVVVVVRVAPGTDEAQTLANVVGGVDPTTGAYTGVHAFVGAESLLGVRPRILIAPGWTHQHQTDPDAPTAVLGNPVIADMKSVAARLRAVIIKDGPSTTDDAALAAAEADADDVGRVYLVDPWTKKTDSSGAIITVPASAAVAGMIVRSDNERGFWWSPSNQTFNGVIGTGRPIDFVLGDATSRANVLNDNKIATIIRDDGFRLWGNRTLSSDDKWAFLCVRRTADIINDSLARAHRWAVDRGITKNYVSEVVEGVNAYLRHLVSIGAIIGGNCYADPDLNTPDQIAQGKVYFDFDFTPVYPAEHVTFRSRITNDYLTEIF